MRWYLAVAALAAALGFTASAASATTVDVTFSGTINFSSDPNFQGTAISGAFTTDLANPTYYSDAHNLIYGFSGSGSGTIDTTSFAGGAVFFSNDFTYQTHFNSHDLQFEFASGDYDIQLYFSSSVLSPGLIQTLADLPPDLTALKALFGPDLTNLNTIFYQSQPVTSFALDTLTFHVIQASPVSQTPVPAALPLLATALAGLGFAAWRRRTQHAAPQG
jgi:hypothetical protein